MNNIATIVQIVVPLLTAFVGFAAFLTTSATPRAQVKRDAEILAALPEDNEARADFNAYVAARVRTLIDQRSSGSRDIGMLAVALIAAPALSYFAVGQLQAGFQGGSGWHLVAGIVLSLLALVFIYGIFDSGAKVPRDAKGYKIDKDGNRI